MPKNGQFLLISLAYGSAVAYFSCDTASSTERELPHYYLVADIIVTP
ncbi:MAG: hypothetical protein ACI9UQ_000434 [Candidatus Krumholzibacteriia bacterium]|jgi:hypothetical protein